MLWIPNTESTTLKKNSVVLRPGKINSYHTFGLYLQTLANKMRYTVSLSHPMMKETDSFLALKLLSG